MKRRIIVIFLAVLVLGLGISGCGNPNSVLPAFAGTWQTLPFVVTATWEYTATTATYSSTGLLTGTMGFSIQAFDEAAHHIRLYQTSATDDFAGSPNGTIYYLTYSISGDEFYESFDPTDYPATADQGPYYKQ